MATQRKEAGEQEDDYLVPLSRQAVALLRELRKITGESKYLFPGQGTGETMSENTINYALHALGYKGIRCAHGFRSSASTILNPPKDRRGAAPIRAGLDRDPARSPRRLDPRDL